MYILSENDPCIHVRVCVCVLARLSSEKILITDVNCLSCVYTVHPAVCLQRSVHCCCSGRALCARGCGEAFTWPTARSGCLSSSASSTLQL